MAATLTLVFTTSATHWLSRSIRAITSSECSHVAIGCELFGEPVLLHSALNGKTGQNGVQITPRDEWLKDNDIVEEYEFIPDLTPNMGVMIRHLGAKYDKMGLIGYLLVYIAKWLGKTIMNPLRSPTALLCPRYVLKLDPTGVLVPEWKGLDPEHTTPHDLLVICRQGSSFKKV